MFKLKNSPFWAYFCVRDTWDWTNKKAASWRTELFSLLPSNAYIWNLVWRCEESSDNDCEPQMFPKTNEGHLTQKIHSIFKYTNMRNGVWDVISVLCIMHMKAYTHASHLIRPIWNAVESFSFFHAHERIQFQMPHFFRSHPNKYCRIIHYYLKWNRSQNGDSETVLSSEAVSCGSSSSSQTRALCELWMCHHILRIRIMWERCKWAKMTQFFFLSVVFGRRQRHSTWINSNLNFHSIVL